MKFCPRCSYFLYLTSEESMVPNESAKVNLTCKNCGFHEQLVPKTKEEALILETNFRSGSSAGGAASGITINANTLPYTLRDPTLPHVKTLRCPNGGCPSQEDESLRDVIYIKTDPTNLKFQYVCTKCNTLWTS